MLFEKIALWYSLLHDFHMFHILCPNLMKVQNSKGKTPHTYQELITRIMTFEYEELLLLNFPQSKVASNIAITKKNKSEKSCMPGTF